jgi:hypothetical protein
MTIFRYSVLTAALVASASLAQGATGPDPKLRLAAKAALGRLEIRQNNVPGPGETTIIKADRLLELPFGPVLITTVTIDRGSHAESGALGVYYLRRVGVRYVLQNNWPKAVDGGGFGYPPDWSVTTRFTQFPAIYATAGWGGQGFACGWSTLTELTPSGPVESDTIFNSKSNRGVGFGKLDEANGRIANIRKSKSFDVVATGTSRFVEHYLFRKDRFVRLEQDSRLQC